MKDLHNQDYHDGIITHLEPDILECKVKWALGSITMNKASGGDGIPVELFQILKDDAVKELHSICQQIWKSQQWPQDWKRAGFIPIPKKGNATECSSYHTIALISHTRKIMLKILQARFWQYVNCELPDVQAGFRKGRGTRDQIANICWIIEEAREFQKKSTSALLTMAKTLMCQFSCSVVSSSLKPHGLQHARPPCPSPTPGVYSNSCPLSQWCHPTISSSVVPFSSCLQSFPASESFQINQFFTSGGLNFGIFDCVNHNKLWKFLQEMRTPDHLTCLLRNLHAGQEATVRTEQGTTDWFQIGKGLHQGCILSPCLFICRVHHVKCQAGWSTSGNQDCWEKYQYPQICRWHHPYGRKWRRTKESLDESERGEWKSWLKAQHSEN